MVVAEPAADTWIMPFMPDAACPGMLHWKAISPSVAFLRVMVWASPGCRSRVVRLRSAMLKLCGMFPEFVT
ncbi:unannotated protein [freshwater metagenome]|uniref:Unannotated protein n=1 Tax=freshwater metagenome TaxID=449393 RepID=A0A6J6PTS3_9ZZZZ